MERVFSGRSSMLNGEIRRGIVGMDVSDQSGIDSAMRA